MAGGRENCQGVDNCEAKGAGLCRRCSIVFVNKSPAHRARVAQNAKSGLPWRARMAWCPEEYREEYQRLRRNKHIPASEARQLIEDQIIRDAEAQRREAAREVHLIKARMEAKHQRDLRDRY